MKSHAYIGKIAEALGVPPADIDSWIACDVNAEHEGADVSLVDALAAIARFRASFNDTAAFHTWPHTPHELLEWRSLLAWLADGRIRTIAEFVADAKSGHAT